MGRAASTMRGLDRRGWNASQADGLWSAVSSEWVCLRGGLIPTARDLFRRSALALILNRFQGTDLGPPAYGPYLPGQGPYPPLPFCVDLGYAPWLTPEQQLALLATQGLARLTRSPSAAGASTGPRPRRPRRRKRSDGGVLGDRPGHRPGRPGRRAGLVPVHRRAGRRHQRSDLYRPRGTTSTPASPPGA